MAKFKTYSQRTKEKTEYLDEVATAYTKTRNKKDKEEWYKGLEEWYEDTKSQRRSIWNI